METSGFGVTTDPQELQKRLLSNNSVEHAGHLIISLRSRQSNQSGTQVSHLRTAGRNFTG
jgi:hypothetical protein